MITFLKTADSPVKAAVAPILFQYSATHAATDAVDESAVVQAVAALAAGDAAYNGGQIVNKGCKDLILTVTFLGGDDCEVCTADTLTTVQETIIVPANSSLELPNAFWQAAEYVLSSDIVDGEPNQDVYVYSAYAPACPECVKLAV
jgi:hypothetical protein